MAGVIGVKCGGDVHGNGHDCNAAFVGQGDVVAIQAERLDRIRKSEGWKRGTVVTSGMDRQSPEFVGCRPSVEYCLQAAGATAEDVGLFVCDDLGALREQDHELKAFTGHRPRVARIGHHLAHAASAFFSSPFDRAAILVVDGSGGRHSTAEHAYELQSAFVGEGLDVHRLWTTWSDPATSWGIGGAYALHEQLLKLEAGKVMGLAGYGGRDSRWAEPLFRLDGDHVWMRREVAPGFHRQTVRVDRNNVYGLVREWDEDPLDDPWPAIACKVQTETEDAMLYLARQLRERTKLENLCLAGGVALNGLANHRILQEAGFKRLFIQPAADDKGIGLGCALYGYHTLLRRSRWYVMTDTFLGRPYSDDEIQRSLTGHADHLTWKRVDPASAAADRLAAGESVAWFQGRSEYGPRALGNRSLLSRADTIAMRDRMNRLKRREAWRPLAPAVLKEHAARYFDFDDCPFMLIIPRATVHGSSTVPGVVHVDRTARLQTVDGRNGPFQRMLRRFNELTGVPMVINTSFNLSGEPIVESPEDALSTMSREERIDTLYLNEFEVTRRWQP